MTSDLARCDATELDAPAFAWYARRNCPRKTSCDSDRQSPKSHGTPSAIRDRAIRNQAGGSLPLPTTTTLSNWPSPSLSTLRPQFESAPLPGVLPDRHRKPGLASRTRTKPNREQQTSVHRPFCPPGRHDQGRCSRRSKPPGVLVWWRRGRHPSQQSTPKSSGACNWHHGHSRSLNLEPSGSHGWELAVLLPAHISLLESWLPVSRRP
jgi:hypothetical protein